MREFSSALVNNLIGGLLKIRPPWSSLATVAIVLLGTFCLASICSRHSVSTTRTWFVGIGLAVFLGIPAEEQTVLVAFCLLLMLAVASGLDALAQLIVRRTGASRARS